jgi:uncharacterized protein (TIGR02145 family)
LPLAGFRNNGGSLFDAGSASRYWSSTVSGTTSRYLEINSSPNAYMNSNARSLANSVRCLKD